MKKQVVTIVLMSLLIASCEKFPTVNELKGSWVEQSDNPLHRLVFDDEIMYRFEMDNMLDTYYYQLDKKEKLLRLILKSNPSMESSHRVLLNPDKKELIIWGLLVGIPEQSPSKTKFKRE